MAPLAAIPGLGTLLSGLTSALPSQLQTVLSSGPGLGSLDIDVTPHAIGNPSAPPTLVGGTQAAGELNLVNLDIAPTLGALATQLGLPSSLTTLNLANLTAGHMITSVNNTDPITCSLPIVKAASQNSVAAGGSFTYTIQIPNPADSALLACDLTNVGATDTISDKTGDPSFSVTGADNGGTTTTTSPHAATVSWHGLSVKAGASLQLHVTVSVPSGSAAGLIQDIVTGLGDDRRLHRRSAGRRGDRHRCVHPPRAAGDADPDHPHHHRRSVPHHHVCLGHPVEPDGHLGQQRPAPYRRDRGSVAAHPGCRGVGGRGRCPGPGPPVPAPSVAARAGPRQGRGRG